ncbi:MAG: serine/threonine-protein kinase [Xenococcaceae cyanobacterium MO_167.B27]|nr:serine/threonine-protein kinase [Xenococcaceae cyanobacterium MO_167.B27]
MIEQLIGGRYQIVTNLGSGGFGKTYLAEDIHQFNLRCVVKKLQPLSPSPTTWSIATQLFQREAQTQYRLGHHPQIPQLLAYFQDQQEFYLVQELIEGHNLTEELTPGKQFSESEVISLLQDILEPVAFVHQQKVVHRDLKPPNLIRRHRDHKIVLIDFGAVKELAAIEILNPQGETKIVTTIGTPGYMPSEQSKGQARFSSDVYAVGIIGIQALTGKMPQELPEEPETAEIIWREQITVSPKLGKILDKMVRYDFRERYRSASEALEAVQQLTTEGVQGKGLRTYNHLSLVPLRSPQELGDDPLSRSESQDLNQKSPFSPQVRGIIAPEQVTTKQFPPQNQKYGEIRKRGNLQPVPLEFPAFKRATGSRSPQHCEMSQQGEKLLPPQHQEIIKSLHLETKSGSPYSLLKEVFDWTRGHPLLTRQLCQVISNANYFIPSGMESTWVEKLVQEHVIHNWKNQVLGEYLKTIEAHLLNNTICLPQTLLKLYLQIWHQGEVSTNQIRAKKELINLGLIIEQENKLKVANRIYQSVFNPDWVKKQLLALEKKSAVDLRKTEVPGADPIPRSPKTSNQARKIPPPNQQISQTTQIKNEPLTQIAALMSLLGLLIISPLVIFLNNSPPQLSPETDSLDAQSLSRSTLCVEPIPAEEAKQEDWLSRLNQEQQRLPEQFPANCQDNLDRLIVLNALELGKQNRVLDGIEDLCQISPTSASFNQAQFWLNRWYNSADWGEQTQSYLNSVGDCPPAPQFSTQF